MKQKILYLECNSGISGDMTIGALLDLGVEEERLRTELEKLELSGYRIQAGRTNKCGIDSCSFTVRVQEEQHYHRTFNDIQRMISNSGLTDTVKAIAEKIFYVLAKAEAKVHGVTIDNVHFHEVGAVDSIVDIVGTAICMEALGITDVIIGTMAEGGGITCCQHGQIPIPVPAVAELAAEYGLPLKQTNIAGEMITPTGAAIAAALRTREMPEDEFIIRKIGIGAGTKDFPHANILRAMIIEEVPAADDIWVLETNVDDCSGEQLGLLQSHLFESGVTDVIVRPIYMKKNRPAYQLQVLCQENLIELVEDRIFKESTTIGIRRYRADRTVLERRMETLATPWGDAQIKLCHYGGRTFYYPEYESIQKIAESTAAGYREIYNKIVGKAEEEFGK